MGSLCSNKVLLVQLSLVIGLYFDLRILDCFILVESILKTGGVPTSNLHLIILVESILKTGGAPTSNRHLIILPSAR